MVSKRFATIDIGTNTILMLIAEKTEDGFNVLRDEHSLARLGEGIGVSGSKKMILPSALERAKVILNKYKHICSEYRVDNVFAGGTSALRDADNSVEIRNILSSIIDTDIQLISGEDEAEYSFNGSIEDDKDSVVIDIGGGSTEIIVGSHGKITFRKSLQIGAVRLTEMYFAKHPPDIQMINDAANDIKLALKSIQNDFGMNKLYAVAGTPTTLAGVDLGLKDFDRKMIHGHLLFIERIESIFKLFSELSISEIIDLYHVKPQRADLITIGTLILIESMKHIGALNCQVSTKGLRYGMMKSFIKKIN